MDLGIIDTVIQQGGIFGLAVFAMWWLNRVWGQLLETEKRHGEERERLWDMTRQALERNTEAMTRLAEKLQA